jgi:hypothetical protein
MTQGNRRDWREICEEVLRERSPERVSRLLEELLDVLETRVARRVRPSNPTEVG